MDKLNEEHRGTLSDIKKNIDVNIASLMIELDELFNGIKFLTFDKVTLTGDGVSLFKLAAPTPN